MEVASSLNYVDVSGCAAVGQRRLDPVGHEVATAHNAGSRRAGGQVGGGPPPARRAPACSCAERICDSRSAAPGARRRIVGFVTPAARRPRADCSNVRPSCTTSDDRRVLGADLKGVFWSRSGGGPRPVGLLRTSRGAQRAPCEHPLGDRVDLAPSAATCSRWATPPTSTGSSTRSGGSTVSTSTGSPPAEPAQGSRRRPPARRRAAPDQAPPRPQPPRPRRRDGPGEKRQGAARAVGRPAAGRSPSGAQRQATATPRPRDLLGGESSRTNATPTGPGAPAPRAAAGARHGASPRPTPRRRSSQTTSRSGAPAGLAPGAVGTVDRPEGVADGQGAVELRRVQLGERELGRADEVGRLMGRPWRRRSASRGSVDRERPALGTAVSPGALSQARRGSASWASLTAFVPARLRGLRSAPPSRPRRRASSEESAGLPAGCGAVLVLERADVLDPAQALVSRASAPRDARSRPAPGAPPGRSTVRDR